MAEARTLDKVGVFARSAEDCASVLAAIAGADRADPTCVGLRFVPLSGRAAASTVRRARVGVADEEFAGVFASALKDLTRIVARVSRATLPEWPYREMVNVVLSAEGATEYAALIESDRLEALVRPRQVAGLRAGLLISARTYMEAMYERERIRDDFARMFETVDVIVSPTQRRGAPELDELDGPRPGARGDGPNAALTAAANLAGLPGIAIPCGLDADGLPLGLQLVGPPFSEPLLLAIAAAYQRETSHHETRPPSARAAPRPDARAATRAVPKRASAPPRRSRPSRRVT
jgi:Asp-tRNA(Asn)/Glu-tRNA(Gln) amidotransferase A subunit family amidase